MHRLNYARRRPSPYRPRGAGFDRSEQLAPETTAEQMGAAVGSIRAGPATSDDDDPLDQLLRAAAVARQGARS
jgi:hypothetical protein